MNHRKASHPSNKKCRNFKNNECIFNEDCWYVHEEDLMDVDESFSEVKSAGAEGKCLICGKTFPSKSDCMKHKKESHASSVRDCELYLKNNCSRIDSACW